MSMQPRANRADTRRRYTHQAYDVTYFGKALETGPSGVNMRLQGTPRALITLTGRANITTPQRAGDLTAGVIVTGLINHVALSAGTTITLSLPAWNGLPAVDITVDAILTAEGVVALDAPIWAPLPVDRPLDIIIEGGSAQDFIVSLEVTPILNGWF